MKIFLLTSFSAEVDNDGNVQAPFRMAIEAILAELRAAGHTVSCAVETDGWKLGTAGPAEGTQADLAAIDAADGVVAIYLETSAGMLFELGYATAKGKKVILVMDSGSRPGWFMTGVAGLDLVTVAEPSKLLASLN